MLLQHNHMHHALRHLRGIAHCQTMLRGRFVARVYHFSYPSNPTITVADDLTRTRT